jgi:hypothetical protein
VLIHARTGHCRLNQSLRRLEIVDTTKCHCGEAEVGTIYCMDRFDNSLNCNRKFKLVHEIDTHYVFDVT